MRVQVLLRWSRIHLRRLWWLQAILLGLIWLLCDQLTRALRLPLPGSVVGFGLLLLALETRLLSVAWLRRGATGLLAHLVLFFVPTMLAVVNHRELLSATGLKLLAVVLLGTPLVILGTAAVVEIGFRWEENRDR
jgi:holin-like protein